MNEQSPLIPQGSFLEQKNKGRARVKIAVFVVLAIHGIGLLALLMQGCKKEPEAGTPVGAEQTNATTAPAFAEPTNVPPPLTNQALAPSNTTPENVTPAPLTSAPPPVNPTEYKIQAGDTLSSIAPKFHTTVKALLDANAGIDPKKLQVGQTIHIPAPTVPTTATAPGTTAPGDVSAGQQTYVVKSGDTLSSIGTNFKVSVRAIMSANSLTNSRIKVGQTLKIPVKSAPTTAPTDTTAPAQ